MLYRKESSGDIKGEDAKFTLLSRGLDVLEIDGERKLVIALEDSNNPPGDPLYIIPDTTHLNQCVRKNAPHAMEFEPDCDLLECLRNAASAATRLVKSNSFLEADDIEQQQRMLDEEEAIDTAMSKLVYIFDNLYQGYQIRCTAKKCWAIPVDIYESYSPEDIARLPAAALEPGKEMFEINGDVVDIFVPEMIERKEKITSLADLPLSHGQPMLQITDVSDRGLVYLIPIESVSGIMPFAWSDETKG